MQPFLSIAPHLTTTYYYYDDYCTLLACLRLSFVSGVWCENDEEWKQKVNEKVFSPRHPPVRLCPFHVDVYLLACKGKAVRASRTEAWLRQARENHNNNNSNSLAGNRRRRVFTSPLSPKQFSIFFGFLSSQLSSFLEEKNNNKRLLLLLFSAIIASV